MLSLASDQPEWIVLFPATATKHEVTVEFAPIDIRAVRAARRALGLALDADREDFENAGDEMSRELIRRGIRAWRGIGVDGVETPVTPETIARFAADPRTFAAADRLYVSPWLERDREGNGSSASPDGTGEAAMPAPDTASTPATGAPTAAADPTPIPAKAAAATSSTRRGRKKD